jgi:hypothetical protein
MTFIQRSAPCPSSAHQARHRAWPGSGFGGRAGFEALCLLSLPSFDPRFHPPVISEIQQQLRFAAIERLTRSPEMIASADFSRAEARFGMKKEGLSGTTKVVPSRMAVCIWQPVFGSLYLAVCIWHFVSGSLYVAVCIRPFVSGSLCTAACVELRSEKHGRGGPGAASDGTGNKKLRADNRKPKTTTEN